MFFNNLGRCKAGCPLRSETKRQQAVEFLRRIGNDDDADRFDDMDARDYAEHKGLALIDNPQRQRRYPPMARTKSRTELQADLDHANDYIEELEGKLDNIAGIAAGDEEDEDEEDGEDDEDDD